MKLIWISTAFLFMSVNAFAACPAGTQGNTKFDEAVATIKRQIGETVRAGSHTEEKTTDGKPLKIDFDKSGDDLKVTVWRSTGGKIYNTKQLSAVAEVCAGGGQLKLIVSGYEVQIEDNSGGGMKASVSGYGPYTFGAITTGTQLANTGGASR
ncbi:MAG: hypothetical protein ACXVA9_06795 [Bdellovibrionales bacterium]